MPGPSSVRSPPPDGEPLDPDQRVGTVLAERYRLDALLGEGGMGKVYAAEHVLMRKKLAVKILHRELTSVPEVVARFEREAMAAANIDHPNVAAATDFGKLVDGAVFLVLEYVQGTNLRDEIAAGPMPVERALGIGRQIASALGSAHALNIVHRDLKPENVMLVERAGDPDFVKVLDFGIAKVPIGEHEGEGRGRAITKVGMVFGTPEYMAPEQALGQNVDGRADLYALGVIMYEMLSGVRPFSSKSQVGILGQQLSKPAPPFSERAPGIAVPPAAEQLVLKLLCKEAGERFQTAADVVAAVDELLGPPARSGRMFTLTGGSPRAFGSSPDMGSAPDGYLPVSVPALDSQPSSNPVPLPRFPDSPDDSWPDGVLPVAESPPLDDAKAPSAPLGPLPTLKLPSNALAEALPSKAPEAGAPAAALANAKARTQALWQSVRQRAQVVQPKVRAWPRAIWAKVHAGARAVGLFVLGSTERLSAWVDERRARLPDAVRVPLKDVSTRALLGVSLFLALAIVVGLIALVGALVGSHHTGAQAVSSARVARISASSVSPSAAPSASPAPPGGGASDAQIAKARAGGVAGLLKLSERFPKDTRVMLELAQAYLTGHQPVRAVALVGRVLSRNPSLNQDPKVANLLSTLAKAPRSENSAFALLEGPMGAKGADIIFDLSTAKGVSYPVKHRAERWLHTDAFQKNSSAALNVAVALRFAKQCSQRYALLLRAKAVGDKRSLVYLEPMESRRGCGPGGKSDCNLCLRGDDRLKQTIAAVEQRSQ